MAILNIFKRRKKEPKKKPSSAKAAEGKEEKKEGKVTEEPKVIKEEKIGEKPEQKRRIRRRKKFLEAYKVLRMPHITEKATDLAKEGQYIFRVWPRVNKMGVKKAIEDVYGVDVISVNIINVPSKQRRLGRTQGWRKGYKKAIVKIKEGQKIEVLPR